MACKVESVAGKRRLTFSIIFIFFLLKGVEYSIILPTALEFLKTMGSSTVFFGFVIGSYNFAALITAPLFGYWFDKRPNQLRVILIVANSLEIVGNFMYFLGLDKWLLLTGRFVAGLGVGVVGSVYGYVARVTDKEKRTSMFALAFLMRLLGIIIGPACHLFLLYIDVKIGSLNLNKFTSPGLLMVVFWIILNVPIWLGIYGLDEMNSNQTKEIEMATISKRDNNNTDDEATPIIAPKLNHSDVPEADAKETTPLHNGSVKNGDLAHVDDVIATDNDVTLDAKDDKEAEKVAMVKREEKEEEKETRKKFLGQFSVIVFSFTGNAQGRAKLVLTLMPFLILNHLAIETLLPDYTKIHFKFDGFWISIMYLIGGLQTVAVLFSLQFISRRVSDRKIMLTGLVLSVFAMTWGIVFLPRPFHAPYPGLMVEFIILGFVHLLGTPMVIVSQAALLSKITTEEEQGRSQGIRTSVDCVASIIGPIMSGAMAHMLYGLFGILLGLAVIFTIAFGLVYKKLKYTDQKNDNVAADAKSDISAASLKNRKKIYLGKNDEIPTVTQSLKNDHC